MSSADGGEAHLAPVIPLFAPTSSAPTRSHAGPGAERAADSEAAPARTPARASALASATQPGPRRALAPAWGATWLDDAPGADLGEAAAAAETALVRRLRGKQLSVSEARSFLRERDVDDDGVEVVIQRCLALGYLDDGRLSEQLVHAAVTRKGQGRQAIGLALKKRGIDRSTADAALDALPDDEAERAAEFAHARARQFRDLDRETALRRLVGQLSRRGFSSSTALGAAGGALDELV